MLTWPPAYTIKPHPRTRQVKLKASLKKGLELIVPLRFNVKHIPNILLENKAWIEKQLLKLAEYSLEQNEAALPEKITLHALDQTWNIHYIENHSAPKMISRPHNEIAIIGKIQHKTACKKLLISWLKKLAKIHLFQQLNMLSEETGLPYTKLSIRDQQTRWGSCTHNKNISLNYKILFLPAHLARHILIHELCHTVHLNHSDRFWKLVEKYDPDWQVNRIAVRKVSEFVPGWT